MTSERTADPDATPSGDAPETIPPTRIVLAVGGGVAAYKSAIVASRLVQSGIVVDAMMTRSATMFLGPPTLAAITGRAVVTDGFDPDHPAGPHIAVTAGASAMVVVPATANLIAAMAGGVADDVVSTSYLQCECPVWVCPAMSSPMWDHPATVRNVARLRDDGVHIIEPETGWLACGRIGSGRLADPERIAVELSDGVRGGMAG